MTGVLLDTNVISELIRPKPDSRVVAFVRRQTNPWLSTLAIHEISFGAERVVDQDRKMKLLAWLADIRRQFAERIINVDAEIAEQAGQMRASAAVYGITTDPIDALVAASAAAKGAAVATRNIKDFQRLGVALINPWSA